ncbi:hypothetical protein GGR35_001515 [Mucilaginibacter phyllosphaerae]|uniref:Uncharacterized protein n=1 Tax=Mucilaginibacter phyllosphaerae TaxID=1812349 RepID=A0ABR6I7A6_9SPHI|nr:hypothetical protein [Mucilaginibacter phyllosphaerae]
MAAMAVMLDLFIDPQKDDSTKYNKAFKRFK